MGPEESFEVALGVGLCPKTLASAPGRFALTATLDVCTQWLNPVA